MTLLHISRNPQLRIGSTDDASSTSKKPVIRPFPLIVHFKYIQQMSPLPPLLPHLFHAFPSSQSLYPLQLQTLLFVVAAYHHAPIHQAASIAQWRAPAPPYTNIDIWNWCDKMNTNITVKHSNNLQNDAVWHLPWTIAVLPHSPRHRPSSSSSNIFCVHLFIFKHSPKIFALNLASSRFGWLFAKRQIGNY